MTRLEFADHFRSYIGVPFQYQGRTEEGLDCSGLLIKGAQDLGFAAGFDFLAYTLTPGIETAHEQLLRWADEIRIGSAGVGDVVLFEYLLPSASVAHMGVLNQRDGALTVIEADGSARMVIERRLTPARVRRIVKAYRVRGLGAP